MGLNCTLYPQCVSETSETSALDIGRRWGLLDYLLAASAGSADGEQESLLTRDWEEVASEAHLIPAEAIAEFADWLAGLEDETILSYFDPEAMARKNIYDADQAQADPGAYRNALTSDLAGLRTVLSAAARSGENVIRVIC